MLRRPRLFSLPACTPALAHDERRAIGAYYTPPKIVRLVVDATLASVSRSHKPPRVLEPSCGAGEFAIEVQRQLMACYGVAAARKSLVAIDSDAKAAALARRRLQAIDPDFSSANILIGDTLFTRRLAPASFDVVLGNPPYINIRQLGKSMPRRYIDRLRQRFSTARGNFDLYVPFIERVLELLKPGGRCGLIIPGKWATLDYARRCRELLLKQATIEQIVDLSDARAFADACVFPHVLIFRKEIARASHTIASRQCSGVVHRIRQKSLSAVAFQLAPSVDVESRVSTRPLSEVATLACGTAGYTAKKIADRLRDATTLESFSDDEADFITSGNIDRYSIRLGHVRYMNHDYVRPSLALDIPELTVQKRKLFISPKIVIAGMSRRLEAAWDERGLALGVQVFAASECNVDPRYLLALLNSKLLSYLFATRYAAKRLSGGYLAINKLQLAQLPIAIADEPQIERLSRLALQHSQERARQAHIDAQIDRLTYQLYKLTKDEIDRVEADFTLSQRRAA